MGRHPGIDFWWILVDFWSQVGWKIHQKSIQKGIEKTIEKSRRLGSVLEASWGVLRRLGLSWRPPGVPRARPSRVLERHEGVLAADMATTWLAGWNHDSESNRNRSKKRLKFRCLLGSVYKVFWSVSGRKMKACWLPKWRQNRCYPQKRFKIHFVIP